MIKELTQFIDTVPNIIKERALEPKAGLHILIKFDEEGKASILGSERYLGKKHGETSQFLKDCSKRQEAAWMIDTNKCFDLPAKGIHSASPFCVAFKRESWIGGEKYPKDNTKPNIIERLEGYFAKTFDEKYKLGDVDKQKAIQFKNFLRSRIDALLNKLPEYEELDFSDYLVFYKDEPIEKYIEFNGLYKADGLFNTSEFNIEFDGQILGTSNFYNGFNSKKPFLTHQTATFDITGRISAKEAKALTEFQLYANKRLLPNPLPVFIDAPELTQGAINIFHRDENIKPSHREIISELWKRKEDLGNYYLIYFTVGAIKDFDFVSKFNYHLNKEKDSDGNHKPWKIENVTEIKDKEKSVQSTIELHSVFDFERVVIRQLFNNSLVKIDEKKNEVSMRYFDDIDAKYYRPALYTLILKYRKPIYDFIYKSMSNGIGVVQFEDICMTGIMDDLKENKDYSIKAKLNLYFSLYQYFDTNKSTQIMPSKIKDLKHQLAKTLDDADAHIQTDEQYAFGAGQLICYLLSKSEAGERTHAVLEPFLQKTNHSHFNEAIANTLMRYKHAIGFDQKRFNKLSSEILGYIPETGLQILRPLLLAGYFCPNIFYTKKTESQN